MHFDCKNNSYISLLTASLFDIATSFWSGILHQIYFWRSRNKDHSCMYQLGYCKVNKFKSQKLFVLLVSGRFTKSQTLELPVSYRKMKHLCLYMALRNTWFVTNIIVLFTWVIWLVLPVQERLSTFSYSKKGVCVAFSGQARFVLFITYLP